MPSDEEIRAILREPGTSQWMCAALDRDPVDEVNDAELLAIVLRDRAEVFQSDALAAVAIRRAKDCRGESAAVLSVAI